MDLPPIHQLSTSSSTQQLVSICLSCAWSMVQEYERFRYVVFFFEKGPFHLLSFLSFMKKYLIHQSSKGWKARSTALCSISGISIHHLDLVQLFCGFPPSFSTSIRMRLLMRLRLRATALISSWPLQFCTLDLWDVIASVLDWYVILFVSMKLWGTSSTIFQKCLAILWPNEFERIPSVPIWNSDSIHNHARRKLLTMTPHSLSEWRWWNN